MSRKSVKHRTSRKESSINRIRKIASAKIAPSFRPIIRKGRSIRPGTCANCGCPEKYTNLWRSGKDGRAMKKNDPSELRAMLCNACGLWLSEKGTPRPNHLASKWLVTAREDAEAQYHLAIENGADPSTISVEDYMPRSQPVMPIAATRGPDSDSAQSSPRSASPYLPSSPISSHSDHREQSHTRASNHPGNWDHYTMAQHGQSSDHEAASALMTLFSQAKGFVKSTCQAALHAPSSARHEPMPSCRLFDKKAYVPAWMANTPRSPTSIPPLTGFLPTRNSHDKQRPSRTLRPSPSRSANGRLALSVAQLCQQPATSQPHSPALVPSYFADETRLHRRESDASTMSGASVPHTPFGRRSSGSSYASVQLSLLNTPVDQVYIAPEPLLLSKKLQIEGGRYDHRSYFA